jgi:hypothetical protein
MSEEPTAWRYRLRDDDRLGWISAWNFSSDQFTGNPVYEWEPLYSAATIERLTRERDEAIKLRNEWHKNWQDAESELDKAQRERDEARRQRDLAEIMRSGTERMVMADRDAIAAELAKAREALAFVAKMAWRTDPPNVVNNLTDEERLSAIKWHPTIREVSKPHRELAEREAAISPAKTEDRP